jgi:hypothetical protein
VLLVVRKTAGGKQGIGGDNAPMKEHGGPLFTLNCTWAQDKSNIKQRLDSVDSDGFEKFSRMQIPCSLVGAYQKKSDWLEERMNDAKVSAHAVIW